MGKYGSLAVRQWCLAGGLATQPMVLTPVQAGHRRHCKDSHATVDATVKKAGLRGQHSTLGMVPGASLWAAAERTLLHCNA